MAEHLSPEVKEQTNNKKSHLELLAGGLLLASLVVFVGGTQSHFMPHTLWLFILFLIPLVVQIGGLIVLYNKFDNNNEFDHKTARVIFSRYYIITMGVCLIFYCSLWWLYSHLEQKYSWLSKNNAMDKYEEMLKQGEPFYLNLFSGFSLLLISILLLLVVRMTYAIIEGRVLKVRETLDSEGRVLKVIEGSEHKGWKFWNPDYLRTGVTAEPFLALLFFLSVFLGVSYLCGLGLAFHDKSYPPSAPALYMSNLYPFPIPTPIPASSTTPTSTPTPTSEEFEFGFVQGFASMPLSNAAKPSYFYEKGRRDAKKDKELGDNWHNESQNNGHKLSEAAKRIKELTEKHERIQIVVMGYSDNANLSGNSYQSNYELAEARAQNTKQKILEKLSENSNDKEWRNIEWSCLSLSNELPESKTRVKVRLEKALEDSSSMLLKGQHPNPLNLMDYVYFANYTITTTGYGDIIPTTAYAKFICSFANIIEVFFLVVFFNVLLSLRRSEKEDTTHSRLTADEIKQIAEGIKREGINESLIEESVKRIVKENVSKNEVLTEEMVRGIIVENESNRGKIDKIEESMKGKVDKTDIDAKVNEILNSFFIFRFLGKHRRNLLRDKD
jgi:hypothetical protein